MDTPIPDPAFPDIEEKLPINYVYRHKQKWCWAACAAMVLQQFGKPWVDQCDIANATFDRHDCCYYEEKCNHEIFMWGPGPSMVVTYAIYDVKCTYIAATVSFQEIKQYIDDGKPVQAGLLADETNHVVVIYGYMQKGGVNSVLIHDPAFGPTNIPFTDLFGGYDGGLWSISLVDFQT